MEKENNYTLLRNTFTKESIIENGNCIRGFLSRSAMDFQTFEKNLHQMGYSFSIRSSKKFKTNQISVRHKFFMLNGIPFSIVKKTYYHCGQGKLYYKLQCHKSGTDHSSLATKKRCRLRSSKKQECPATMTVYDVDVFNGYIATPGKWRETKQVLAQLRKDLSADKNIVRERKLYVTLSLCHNHSILSAQLNEEVDHIIKTKIKRIVMEEKCTNFAVIKAHLRATLNKNNIAAYSIPESFFPDERTLRNYIAKYSFEKKQTKIDLEAISLKVNDWAKNGKVYYRPYRQTGCDIEPILFCYQANWINDFFSTYGSIILMDATHKTTKYSLPLFLLAVRTNVNFCPIGFFIVQHEDSRSISEALKIFHAWNPDWKPQYFMVDSSNVEINAINTVFREPDTVQIKICSFHREQAWEQWLKKSDSLTHKDDRAVLIQLWRDVAKSQDVNIFEENLNVLRNNEAFLRNEKAQRYFENTWLKVSHLWVAAFFDQNFVMNLTTNNGIESLNELLKHSFLKNHTDKSLSNIIEVIIEDYIPSALTGFEIGSIPSHSCDTLPVACLNGPFLDTDETHYILEPVSCAEEEVSLQVESGCNFETEEFTNREKCRDMIAKIREASKKIFDMTYCLEPNEETYEDWVEVLKLNKKTVNIFERIVKKDDNITLLPEKT